MVLPERKFLPECKETLLLAAPHVPAPQSLPLVGKLGNHILVTCDLILLCEEAGRLSRDLLLTKQILCR